MATNTKQKYSNETMYEVLNQVMKNLSEILVAHNDTIKSFTSKPIDVPPIDTTALERCIRTLDDNRTKLERIANTTIKVEQVDTTALSSSIKEMTRVVNEGIRLTNDAFNKGNSNIKSTIQGIKVEQKGVKGRKFLVTMWILSILIPIILGGYGYYFISNISKYEGLIQRHSYLEAIQKDIQGYYDEYPEEEEKFFQWIKEGRKKNENTPPAKSTPPAKTKRK